MCDLFTYLVEVGLHVRLGEVVVERGGDVGLLVVDHPDDAPELRRPPLRRPRPPRREAAPQLPHHRLRRHVPVPVVSPVPLPPTSLLPPATETTAELSNEGRGS